jgi:bacillithiol biosynthesis cysteine-adding enzyme BshC
MTTVPVLDGLELDISRLSSNRLIEDYYAGARTLSPFYAGYPWSRSAFQRRAEQLRNGFTPGRGEILRSAVQATSPRAAEKLGAIAGGHGFVVTTGQQPVLFGGPLHTAYKILTAVKLAETLENTLGVPVAPLFWLPADDHDWHEVNHISILDTKNQLIRLELPENSDAPRSMAHRRLGEAVVDLIAQFRAAVPNNDFATQCTQLLESCYRPDATVADAFRALITQLFAPFDLLTTSSADPSLKRFGIPLFRAELEQAESHGALLRAQTDRLIKAGYHEQVAITPDAANVMYEDETGRERLVRDGKGWLLRRTKRYFEHDELLEMLEAEPERFSANVLLRPVLESFAFPTLAYVGGPAEVSYFAQTGCLFAAHGVNMPLVFPRASLDLVEAKIRKVLDKYNFKPTDFRRPLHELISQRARDELPEGVRAALLQLRRSMTTGYETLVEASLGIDPTLRGPLESARNAGYKQVEDAERKILSHLKKQQQTSSEQLQKASVHLFPDGNLQERVVGAVSYLARYGPDLLTGIARALEVRIGRDEPEGWDGVRCV